MSIQLRGRVTAEELAERLEVSVRTIYRDIDALSRAGVPIVTDRGRNGGLSLVEGYRTKLTGLSASEAQALPFVGLDAAAAALGLEASAEAARMKVLAALPAQVRENAYRASECFHLDPADWYHRTPIPAHVRVVAAATWASQLIEIDYQSWTARRKRVVEPLGLVLKAGHWYMVARVPEKCSTAIFRVDGIREVQTLGRSFHRPKHFRLARAWQEEVQRFEVSLRRAKATLRVSPNAMQCIERLGYDAAQEVQACAPDGEGWRTASIWIESVDHAAAVLLGFGADIEVVTPEELREEIAQRAQSVCAVYRKS